MIRGPKKKDPAANLQPGFLLIKTDDTEPEIKPIEEYPAWLEGLLIKQMKPKHRHAYTLTEDTEAFRFDMKNFKLLRKSLRKRRRERILIEKSMRKYPLVKYLIIYIFITLFLIWVD